MALKFSTLSRSLEEFLPLESKPKQVRMYCCGPTVYDFGHIGNFATLSSPISSGVGLQFRGYEVTHVMNITDVEDKIIEARRETGLGFARIRFEVWEASLRFQTLGCLRPHHLPRRRSTSAG